MSADHPDSQLLERFMRNQADAPERRAVVLHLLGGCAQCVAVTRRLWNLGELQPQADAVDTAGQEPVDGDLTGALGSPAAAAAAEAAFRGALQESLREGLGREAARALLGLALLYERQGRSRDLERLTEELYPICQIRGVGLSVTMALLFFRRLVETGFATQEVLREVARFLAGPPQGAAGGAGGAGMGG